jgi:hypothetical protein
MGAPSGDGFFLMKAFGWSCVLAALAGAPGALAAPTNDACQFNFNVAPGDGGALGAKADFCSQLQQIKTSLNVAIQADPGGPAKDPLAAPGAFTSNEAVGVDAAWDMTAQARLDVSATGKLGQVRSPLSLIDAAVHEIDTNERTASVGLTLTPFKPLQFNLTGQTASRLVDDVAFSRLATPAGQSQFVSANHSAGAGLKWTVARGLSLNAGGKLETASVDWRGISSAAMTGAGLAYSYFEPQLNAALDTPGQGHLNVTAERAVSPIDPGPLSSFAAVSDRSASARFEPNREWRYKLDLNQPLAGDATLTTALIAARLESSTELGPVGAGLQAPISIIGGERSEIDVGLATPLAVLGLPSFTLKGQGVWRASRIRDPFTGAYRPLSGQTPHLATIDLVQSLPSLRARWGLEGRFTGDQSLYQMSQITTVSTADSLGGFIEYAPGAFALRLQIDGLYGGDRSYTDLFYDGARGASDTFLDRVDHRSDNSQAVRLTLNKSF